MDGLWEATLEPNSPRYEEWFRILGTDKVPLKSPAAFECKLGEKETDEVYSLDLKKFNEDQFARLVDFIHAKFGAEVDEIRGELHSNGFPIRSSDVYVVYSLRAFL